MLDIPILYIENAKTVLFNTWESIINYWSFVVIGGLAIWGINYVFNKFPTWIKSFTWPDYTPEKRAKYVSKYNSDESYESFLWNRIPPDDQERIYNWEVPLSSAWKYYNKEYS